MFTAKDKEMLGNPYFNIITENPVMYEVQSKNTGHYWVIMPLIDHQFKYVRLMCQCRFYFVCFRRSKNVVF